MLVQMMLRQKAHGWSHEIEVLVTVYWLACGASYRVTADNFAMPLATVCRTVHHIVEDMMIILHSAIHFRKPEEMEEALYPPAVYFLEMEDTCACSILFRHHTTSLCK
ncbi:putative nuclease HARBI1 [Scomber scombrus]|uniref:Nuclease HARBI1 n=1 Tax=Scomber scombrus TaxID=13677 RepID=A0AAV1NG32_SCOSC